MREFVDKLIERLEESQERYDDVSFMEMNTNGHTLDFEYAKGKMDGVEESIQIAKELAEEHNNGWIACSENMPNERDSVFAKYKGTARWTDAMFEKASDIVNVTVVDAKGKGVTTNAHTVDGQWKCDLLKFSNSFRITHWQPLPEPPEPYKEGE